MSTNTISHYEILAPIGEGGMGIVYRAVDTRLGRAVAVKLLRQDGSIGGDRRKRFMHEARAASALNHPNIITIYDIGRERDVDFIAMEYVAGTSLAELIALGGLGVGECLKFATQIADALAAAHAAGIIHRDLKPGNIMVTGNGSIKVLDFGLAKLAEVAEPESIDERITTRTALPRSSVDTEKGTILGTAAYMSPEQAEGKPADTRSDVFAFGAVLYEMVTGRRAFGAATKGATLTAVLTSDPEPPTRLVPGLPSDLEKIIIRCLRKSPERRWQSMSDLKVALEDLREEVKSRRIERPSESSPASRRPLVILLAVSVVAAAVLGTWWLNRRISVRESPKPFLTRLTSDIGWTDYPTISLDGRMLAYASDRSGEGNLDIWVQHVPDGAPVRLTRDPGDDVDPSFSGDGSAIAFQSSRQGGGIYLVSTLGGEERLLVTRGFSPRFSPDGKWLAYGVAERGGSHIYASPATGGPAMPITPGFYRAQAPVWSPDGRRLLFWGQRERDAPAEGNVDWYVTDVPGGSPSPTEARPVMLREQFEAFQGLPLPDAWAGGSDRILFHATVGDSSNMWQVPISSTRWHINGMPQRVTFGTTDEAAASVTSDGKMVFISRTRASDIWSLPIDAGRGNVDGSLQRVTQDAADDYDPTVSNDGASLVFRSRRAGRFAVVMKKVGSSTETVLVRAPADHYAAINREGTKIAYSFQQNGRMPVFVVDVSGGATERVCDDCGEVKEWLPGGSGILYVTQREPSSIGFLKIGLPPDSGWLRHRASGIYSPRVSSDGGWIAFNSRTDRLATARAFIANIQGAAVASEKDWIEVSKDGEAPSWSPEGTLLYFWSDRDGSPCLWAQRLDPATRRPLGALLSIQHFHSRGLSWKNLHLAPPGIAVAHDRLVFNLGEHTGNAWMTQLLPTKD